MARPGKVQKHNLRTINSAEPVEIVVVDISTRQVRLRIDARVKVIGSYSGREYVFPQAGSVVDVETEDVQTLLDKRQGKGCCGGGGGQPLFELVED